MSRVAYLTLVPSLVAFFCGARPAEAQFTVAGRGASVTVGGLLQPQYTVSSIDSAVNDFYLRRARLRADARVGDFLRGRIVTEFGVTGQGIILDADVTFEFSDAFELSFGQFKRSFDLFHLPNPSDLPEIERQGLIEGYTGCAGVGNVCSYSRFTEALLLAGRDAGVRVDGDVGRVTYSASVTNGPLTNSPDENNAKSFSGRVGYNIRENFVVTGQLALHDYVDDEGDASALAFGGEVDIGTWLDGWHIRAALLTGENWRELDPVTLDPATFFTGQGIVTYYYALDGERIAGVEPLARLSYGDPDTDADEDGGFLLTPGFMVYFLGKNRVGANLDIYAPQSGGTEYSLKVQSTLYF